MTTDHIKMLCDISEINNLFHENSIESLLDKIVQMVSDHMSAEVCSIYLLDEQEKLLKLQANNGLDTSHNKVTIKLNEGLVGLTFTSMKPICENDASKHPQYKFYPGINEEKYDAFLSVPIIRGTKAIGVMVIQRNNNQVFTNKDTMAMKATASQLCGMLENIKLIFSLRKSESTIEEQAKEFNFNDNSFMKGQKASEGIALGLSHVHSLIGEEEIISLDALNATCSIDDFDQALSDTESQLEILQEKVEENLSDSASLIFESHLLMLKDRGFTGAMRNMIADGDHVISAIISIYTKYKDIFNNSPNQLIKEKVQDITDLTKRIVDNLLHREDELHGLKDHILISRDLFPSDLLKLSAEGIAGVVLVSGGVTSHVSILARSLNIPLIIINNSELLNLPDKTETLIDGAMGNLYIRPDDTLKLRVNEAEIHSDKLLHDVSIQKKASTKDNVDIEVLININLMNDLKKVSIKAIDGIGLYRTEFPFMIRSSFPSEEEQFILYKRLIEDAQGKIVTFRTLDIGGDKILPYYEFGHEENPFLGMRSIRFSLTHKEIFKNQIKAILRAASESSVKIMFPMISSLPELKSSREIVEQCIKELNTNKVPCNNNPEIGIMIEIPSAVHIIDELAQLSDFFSIGTNDLVQYTLAVDRTNEKVSSLYVSHHPSILRSLKIISEAAIKHEINCSICGDMANKTEYIPFLLGIGIKSLSVDPIYIIKVKEQIASLNIKDCTEHADQLITIQNIEKIESIIF